eukprot:766605-Hanusia_phi.AAC.21
MTWQSPRTLQRRSCWRNEAVAEFQLITCCRKDPSRTCPTVLQDRQPDACQNMLVKSSSVTRKASSLTESSRRRAFIHLTWTRVSEKTGTDTRTCCTCSDSESPRELAA